jgi:hypothetical protein
MSVPGTWPRTLDYSGTPLVIEPSPGLLSGDAGLLPIRQCDERIGLTRAFADALDDPRQPELTEWTSLETVRSRVSDRIGLDARLRAYTQDLVRRHGVYREPTTLHAV